MKFRALHLFATLARKSRDTLRRRFRRPLPGRFQAYSHTLPDRYPWLFEFARANVGSLVGARILSFGCSRGDEVFALGDAEGMTFAVAANTAAEPAEFYDAIFCLAVLCLGDLTVSGATRCDPHLYFKDFERMVADFSRCLKPGGILFLHTTNFRFCDTAVSQNFDAVFEAGLEQLAPDVLFDRDNALLPGARYRPVAFRKRNPAMPTMSSNSIAV